jgi:hypothetical protein
MNRYQRRMYSVVPERSNKTLVPTRNGEAPLLAAQRGHYASRKQ